MINALTEKQQLRIIEQETLKDPTKSHPLAMQKKLFEMSQGQLTNVVSTTKIQYCLNNLKKQLFLPTDLKKICILASTYSNQAFCPKVNFYFLFYSCF